MIDNFEFIDRNTQGEKERYLNGVVQLINKLSAEETNLIRTKLNEIIGQVNLSAVPLYSVFSLKFKGEGNTDLNAIEVGDIAQRYNLITGIWDNAVFNGGDPQDADDYTNIVPAYEPQYFVATGASNIFELPVGMVAQNLFLDRGVRYKGLEWEQVGREVEVLGSTLAAGRKIYITQ
jgi:hypothetical protein